MGEQRHKQGGFTIVELVIGMTVLALVALSFFGLFIAMVNSSVIAKQKSIASTLATNQMEYLKSLPYDSLAIAGGAIYSATPLQATATKKLNGATYTIKSSINYADDAYDGCGSYPTAALKQQYCRNYPAPASAPSTDTNPADYKIVHVSVSGPAGKTLADVDTQVAAKVSETASTTGALFVKVVDSAGNPVSGANALVANSTVSPAVSANDTTDGNGIAIFYGLPPDSSGYDYKITASKTNFSTLVTTVPNGTLQPTYPSQNILTQASSFVTLTIKPQGQNSLAIETTDVTGTALGNVKLYAKGGYKKYTATSDTAYYYDSTATMTDVGGLAALANLVPGGYYFCGDSGATSCAVGATTYYLAAAVPYSGSVLNPVSVPTYDPANPPATTFTQSGLAYYQKVRLMLTTNSNYPRLSSLLPAQITLASDPLANFTFTINGTNLPCGTSSCATTVKIVQGSNTYTATCTGASSGILLNCKANVTGITVGNSQLVVSSGGNTLTLPGAPLVGGFVVTP